MTRKPAPPITNHLPVALRAFAHRTYQHREPEPQTKAERKASNKPASPWTLVFDTETTSGDAAQSLRFGTFQVRQNGESHREGIFYDPDGVTADELRVLGDQAAAQAVELITRDVFVDQVFYGIGYRLRAMIVGFNLPFDISRIALRHEPARRDMRDGFSFTLSEQKIQPNVRIKHLSQSAAFIKFAGQFRQLDSRSERANDRKTPFNAGHFLDVKTLAKALLSRSHTLASLSAYLNVEHPKLDFSGFDGAITAEMVRYAVRDVQATWECYAELVTRFDRLRLRGSRPEKILSEASIGKAYLRGMGIKPWIEMQPNFPPQLLANIMGSYFGGRSEVRIRRDVRQIILCDFLSMYPTVGTLMNLWPFLRGQAMTWRDATAETREWVSSLELAQLKSPKTWRRLPTLVRIMPDADILPVRAAYSGDAASTIGANYLSGDVSLWVTLADCIASKLLTGKAPRIIEAVSFSAGPAQNGLRSADINGDTAYRVKPATEDFFKRVIELRQATKVRRDAAAGIEYDVLDNEQNTLKIAANATSYGIYAEVNVDDLSDPIMTTVHASTCDRFTFRSDKWEKPGPFFHPLVATLICGAARLMLAITERLVEDHGLEWSFCDTDSMAIAKPLHLAPAEFTARVQAIVDWFAALNPYDFDGSILQIEKVNFGLAGNGPEPLYCWAISAKRYALFNLADDGSPILRKISAHGLGHLIAPYDATRPAAGIPAPHKIVLTDGVEHWQHDLWWQIVTAALACNPDEIDLGFHVHMEEPAMSRYGATTPELLNWFKTYNESRAQRDQVKPFNFLLAMIGKAVDADEVMVAPGAKPSRRMLKKCKPIAPYGRDLAEAAKLAFDRETGKPIGTDKLATYADALAQYHIHPESKFLNGGFGDSGVTRRRHVWMIATRHIGKEAQDLERQAYIGLEADAVPSYGITGLDRAYLAGAVEALIQDIGVPHAVKALATNATRLQRYSCGKISRSDGSFAQQLAMRLPAAQALAERVSFNKQVEIQALRDAIEHDGHNATARRTGIDPSNLRRMVRKEVGRMASI